MGGGGGGMDSQYKLLSELLSDQAAFITSPKTSLANYWGHCPPAPQCLRACLRSSSKVQPFVDQEQFKNNAQNKKVLRLLRLRKNFGISGTPENREGARGSKLPSCLFLGGQGGQKCPSVTVFLLILATEFQAQNTTEGTLCLKVIEIHLISLLPYQYKAST